MRLIDADEFIKYIGLDEENAREDNLGEIVTLEDFDRQPTAYDVDRVIEQLKENSKIYCKEYQQRKGSIYLQDVIEIVKAGGFSNGNEI